MKKYTYKIGDNGETPPAMREQVRDLLKSQYAGKEIELCVWDGEFLIRIKGNNEK